MDKDEERKIRDDERRRLAEEAVRGSERDRIAFRRWLTGRVIFIGVVLVMGGMGWFYLGKPTTGTEVADALELATGTPLPFRHHR